MTKFLEVKTEEIKILADLASEIWHEYWKIILSDEQIDYMIEKFQSEDAIKHQLSKESYTYYFINDNGENIGYFGISERKNHLFLSKLYIKRAFRSKGTGRKAFERIQEIAKQKQYKEIQLTVNKYNKNTIQAYLKWGFKTVNSVVTDIGSGFVMDDYIMSFEL